LAKFVLEVNNLTKKFKNRVAVDDVSFEIIEGEIFGLIGQNGAGKTTIIRMLTGLAAPTSGEIIIDGISLKKHFEKAIAKIGGIIENPDLYSYMSGMENLKFYASLYPDISQKKIDDVVKLVGMEKRIHDKVRTYSLGMKQRIGIAQALLHDPKLLILDEPTNGLDPNGIRDMRKFLIGLARKKRISILVSSHILSEMEQLCDTVAIIDNGKILQIKTLEQIKLGLQNEQKLCVTCDYPNYAGKLIMMKYKIPVTLAGKTIMFAMAESKTPEITAMLIKEGVSIFGINTITKSLEDVFTEILESRNGTHGIK
jgi:ABC-2 type transport system ATP-binding protein